MAPPLPLPFAIPPPPPWEMLWFAWLKFRFREPPWLRMPPPPPIPPAARAVLLFTWLKLINAPAPMAVVAILSVFIVPPVEFLWMPSGNRLTQGVQPHLIKIADENLSNWWERGAY